MFWALAGMVGLQTQLERDQVRRHWQHSFAVDENLDSGHTALQQASVPVCLSIMSVCHDEMIGSLFTPESFFSFSDPVGHYIYISV